MLVQLLNGAVYGSLLFVLASGLVLIYGLRRVVNFAHGSLYMLGAYIGYSISLELGFWSGMIGAAICLAIIGVAMDATIFRTLAEKDPLATVLVTFGVLLVLEDVVQTIWGKQNYSFDAPLLLDGSVEVFGSPFPVYRLAIIAISAIIAASLAAWLRYGKVGLLVRAASEDPLVTAIQGVNTDFLSAAVVALGAAFAGVSGVLAGPFLSLSPVMGGDILVTSFVVVVIGGLGSFSGAFIAAMILGQIQSLGAVYLPDLAELFPFLLMIGVLIWKPTGIAGSRT